MARWQKVFDFCYFPLFRHHTKKLNCPSIVSLNSMHGQKASPTTNLGESNTTKVCYKPLCGSKKCQVSILSYLANVLVVVLWVIIIVLSNVLYSLWHLSIQVWEPARRKKPRSTSLICRDTVSHSSTVDPKMMKLSPL